MNLHPISEGRVHESLKWYGKSGTRKLVPPRFMVPMRVRMKWGLSMNLHRIPEGRVHESLELSGMSGTRKLVPPRVYEADSVTRIHCAGGLSGIACTRKNWLAILA